MITGVRAITALLALGTVAGLAACGSGSSSGQSRADAGPDGSSGGDTGGATGAGGRGNGGRAGSGGSIASGGRLGSGGAPTPDAGPACIPLDQVPPPVIPSIDVAGSCASPGTTGCASSLAGSTWGLESVCLDGQTIFPQAFGACSTVWLGSVSQNALVGQATFAADRVDLDLQVSASALLTFPNECHGCRCSDLEAQLRSTGMTGISCSPVCNGGDCTCFADVDTTLQASSAYTLTGGRLTAGTVDLAACATGPTLRIEDGSSNTVFSLKLAADLSTPEICNGRDDDGDGTEDDAPVDCPPCFVVGVCGEGVVATCQGASGWSCAYTAPDHEDTEATCDRRDNDCDGRVDEDLPCREVCNGQDDDGNGTVDDDPLDAPACSGAGVCASGSSPRCNGWQGWSCVATSSAYEVVESLCDGLDNDCNGLVDERCCAAGSARLYYSYQAFGDSGARGSVIERSHLDGSNREVLVRLPPGYVIDVSVDPAAGKVYWADVIAGDIGRANLDGTGIESLFPAGNQPRLALDLSHRDLFFRSAAGVERASLDDLTQRTTLLPGAAPMSMAVDAADGWLFMSAPNQVSRVNLDGTGLITQDQNVGGPLEGVTWDPVGRRAYFASSGGLFSTGEDLSNPMTLINVSYPVQLDIDPRAHRLYWSETTGDHIGSMTTDGTVPTYVGFPLEVIFGQFLACP